MKKLFLWLKGIKVNEVRPDLAKHETIGTYVSAFFIIWILLLVGVKAGIITCIVLIVLYGLYEIGQGITKTGTPSVNDWLASSKFAGLTLAVLLIIYTKYMY